MPHNKETMKERATYEHLCFVGLSKRTSNAKAGQAQNTALVRDTPDEFMLYTCAEKKE